MRERCLICKAFGPKVPAFTCKRCGAANFDTRRGPVSYPTFHVGAQAYTGCMATTTPMRFAYRPRSTP